MFLLAFRSIVLSAFLLTSLNVGRGQEQKPNFSGTWNLNLKKSNLQIPPPSSTIFVIRHDEPHFHLTRTHVFNGKSDTWTIDILTDGKQEVVEKISDEYTSHTRMYWEGSSLVLDMTISDKSGGKATNLVKYSLADNGQTFIALEHFKAPKDEHLNKWVLDKHSH
jgi:hypothetical protein